MDKIITIDSSRKDSKIRLMQAIVDIFGIVVSLSAYGFVFQYLVS